MMTEPLDMLTRMAPTDLEKAAPDWPGRRDELLDEVTRPPHQKNRWITPLGIAASLALLAGVAVPLVLSGFLGQETAARDSGVGATPAIRVLDDAHLLQPGQEAELVGYVAEGKNPGIRSCAGPKIAMGRHSCANGIPLEGISWQQIRDASVPVEDREDVLSTHLTLRGHYQDGSFHVTRFWAEKSTGPVPTSGGSPERANATQKFVHNEARPLCDPGSVKVTRGGAPAAEKAAFELPDLRGVHLGGGVVNVRVADDEKRAREAIAKVYRGPLCIEQAQGPLLSDLEAAQKRLVSSLDEIGLLQYRIQSGVRGTFLVIQVRVLTPDIHQRIADIVGPEVEPFVGITARIVPVK